MHNGWMEGCDASLCGSVLGMGSSLKSARHQFLSGSFRAIHSTLIQMWINGHVLIPIQH